MWDGTGFDVSFDHRPNIAYYFVIKLTFCFEKTKMFSALGSTSGELAYGEPVGLELASGREMLE